MESYTVKKWSTTLMSTCFNTICAFDRYNHSLDLKITPLLKSILCFDVRSVGRSVARPLLLLWRLSLWNNPSASECSLDSRGGEGRTEGKTEAEDRRERERERARPLLSPRQSYRESFITWLGSSGGSGDGAGEDTR